MKTPQKIYRELKPQSRQQFWAISISFFILMLSIWIGITFKLVAIGESDEESQKLEHAQVLNTLIPICNTFITEGDSILSKLVLITALTDDDSIINANYNLIESSSERFYSWADTCLSLGEKMKYLLSKDDYLSISKNDFLVSVSLPIMRNLQDSIKSEELDVYKWRFIFENSNHIFPEKEPSANEVDLSEAKSFLDDLFNYYEIHTLYSKLQIKYRIHSELFNIGKAQLTNHQIDSLRREYENSENLLKQKKCLINYHYIINPLLENFKIVQRNIKPLENKKVSFFPHTKKDWSIIIKEISDIKFSSDFLLSILSLFLFMIIGAFVWYFVLLLVVKKEADNNTEKKEWPDLDDLEKEIAAEKKYITNIWKQNK